MKKYSFLIKLETRVTMSEIFLTIKSTIVSLLNEFVMGINNYVSL